MIRAFFLFLLLSLCSPGWSQEIPKAVPLPTDGNIPRAAPLPARPGPAPPSRSNPPSVAPANPAPANPGTLVGDPQQDLFDYASLIYKQGDFDLASQQFVKYIQSYPRGPNAQGAYYRLAECHLKTGDPARAAETFGFLLDRFDKGEFVAPASYRLGSIKYNVEKNYGEAAKHFGRAEALAGEGRLQLSANFYKALCLQLSGNTEKAIEAYREVVAVKEQNQYREYALRDLASVLTKEKQVEEAIEVLAELGNTASSDRIRAESKAKAGILYSDLGKKEEARQLLEEVALIPDGGRWKANGLFTLAQMLHEEENWQGVVATTAKVQLSDLPAEFRPRLLLASGEAHRKMERYLQALDVYRTVERFYAKSPEASEASYLKLLCLYKLRDKELPTFVDAYVKEERRRNAKSPFISKARLLEGETFFREGKYKQAASAYSQVNAQHLPEEIQPSMLYSRGWCESETGNAPGAVKSLTQFLDKFPEHDLVPTVLATRSLAFRDKGDAMLSLQDAETIIKSHSDQPVLEMALQQAALIRGEQKNWKGMIEAFNQLLTKFPKSIAVPEAHFYIGKGEFELKEYARAIPSLEKAIELDRESYLDRASLRTILCNYFLEDPNNLALAIDSYLLARPKAIIDPKIYTWLGARRFEDEKYEEAARYLSRAATPDRPKDTNPNVWRFLGESRLATKQYERSETAIGHYIKATQRPSNKARGYLVESKARLALGRHGDAQESANDGLALQREGGLAGELNIQLGDIALAEGDAAFHANDIATAKEKYEEAVTKYTVVSQILEDKKITPLALTQMAAAYLRLNEKDKAEAALAERKSRYPAYVAPR